MKKPRLKRFLKVSLTLFIVLLVMFNLLFYLIRRPDVQTYLTQKAAAVLTSATGAQASIRSVDLRPRRFILNDVFLADLNNDTLLYIQHLHIRPSLSGLLKRKIDVKSLEMEKAKLYVHRGENDSAFNYEFILGEKKETANESAPFHFRLPKAELKNLDFHFVDKKEKNEYRVSFSELFATALNINSNEKFLRLDHLSLTNANILVRKLFNAECGLEIKRTSVPGMLNNAGWDVKANHISINNSTFAYVNENKLYSKGGMNYNDLHVHDINIRLENTSIECDTIRSKILELKAAEKCGLVLQSMSANATVSSTTLECRDLNLVTDNSIIKDYLLFSYESFPDFLDFVNRVKMVGDFKNSRVAMKDINYFAGNTLEKIAHNTIWLNGAVKGTVNSLKGKDLVLSMTGNTKFKGDVSFKGLPVFKETFIALHINKLQTTADDLRHIYPNLRYPANLDNLGKTDFSGSFTGFTNDFVADGNLITEIGNVNSDINFKIDPKSGTARYSGNFAADGFDIGRYMNEENLLGAITLSAHLKGKGLNLNTVEASINGNVESFSFHQHEYTDLKVDADLKKRFFSGALSAKDENLDFDFTGTVNLTDSVPVFQFVSDIRKAELRPLNLSKENITVSSSLRIDFSGLTPDNFTGYAGAFKTQVKKGGTIYRLDSLELKAFPLGGGRKEVVLNSDVAQAELTGVFTYRELPNALLELARHYYEPSGSDTSAKEDQVFVLDARLKDTRNLTMLIDSSFRKIGEGYLNCAFNNSGYKFYLNSMFNNVRYGNLRAGEIAIRSESDGSGLNLRTFVDSLFYDDSLVTHSINLKTKVKPDSILFALNVQPDDPTNRLALNGFFETDFQSFALQLLPSVIYVNGDEWRVSDRNRIFYDKQYLLIENLSLFNRQSKLNLGAYVDTAGNHFIAEFNKFELKEITKPFLLQKKLELGGTINGTVTVWNVLTKPVINASLTIDTLKVNKHFIGNAAVTSHYQPGDDNVKVQLSLAGAENNVSIEGAYNVKKKTDYLDFVVNVKNLHLPHVEPFIQRDVSRIRGNLAGKLSLTGTLDDPVLKGTLNARQVAARINYLNNTLSFENEDLVFSKGTIELGDIHLEDEEGNKALATGVITYPALKNVFFDIDIRTDKFLFMNTVRTTSQPFYGRLLADGLVLIKGPFNNIEFYVSGKTKESTNVYIDVGSTQDVNQYSFYRFVNDKQKQKVKTKYESRVKGITLNCDLEATPDATVNLILDYEEGDVINAKGEGNLKIILSNLGELSIAGDYFITDGNYVFSMQNVISKRFSMEKGSSIRWNGDASNATLDITGLYKLRASPYDLLEDIVTSDAEIQKAKNRVQVLLYLYITGSLAQPEIQFDIKVPDADPTIRTSLESKFQLLKYNTNEFNRQVVGLLVLNRFLPQKNDNSEANVASAVSTSVSEFLSNQLSVYLSDWISEFITEIQLDINYRNYQTENGANTGGGQIDFENRQELQLALNKTFLNDRISIDVGGDFDFGQNSQGSPDDKATNIAGDFEIEYSITADGRIKIKAFRKGEYDIFQDRNKNKTGVGISYEKEFNSVKDFFEHIRKRREEKQKEDENKQETPASGTGSK